MPGMQDLDHQHHDPGPGAGKAPSDLVSALRSNSSANYLVFDDGPFADGITSALSAAGLSGKVKVIGEAADHGRHRRAQERFRGGVDWVRSRLRVLGGHGHRLP